MATFHFTAEPPKPQLFTDVQSLNAFSDAQLGEFVGITLAFLGQADGASGLLAEFAAKNGVNIKALNNTIKGILFFFAEALKANMSPEAVQQDLVSLGLDETKVQFFMQIWFLLPQQYC